MTVHRACRGLGGSVSEDDLARYQRVNWQDKEHTLQKHSMANNVSRTRSEEVILTNITLFKSPLRCEHPNINSVVTVR